MPENDGVLNVTLLNALNVPTSIVIAGQALPSGVGGAVFALDVVGPGGCTLPTPQAPTAGGQISVSNPPAAIDNTACRMRSFVGETDPGQSRTYTFAVKPGTYLYQSGTHPQVQVQMGLYGALRKDTAGPLSGSPAREAYAGVPYASEQVLLFSEVDVAQHNQVAATLGSATPSSWQAGHNTTLNYAPSVFMINGKVFDAVGLQDSDTSSTDFSLNVLPGERTILRMLNAGLTSRVPVINTKRAAATDMISHWSVLSEDGRPYPAPRAQYSVFLAAGKTSDVAFIVPRNVDLNPASGRTLSIFDRRFGTDASAATGLGGAVTRIALTEGQTPPSVGGITGGGLVATQGVLYTRTLNATGAATITLDQAPAGLTIGPTVVAGETSSAVINWTPVDAQADKSATCGTAALRHALVVRANAADGRSTNRTFNLSVTDVNDPPVAANDNYVVTHGVLNVAAAQGVLANDRDPECNPLTAAVSGTLPANVTFNADGSLGYSGPQPATGSATYSFAYTASDGALSSAPATVTLTVLANQPPVAANDNLTATYVRCGALPCANQPPVALTGSRDPLFNDRDADGSLNPASVVIVTQPTRRIAAIGTAPSVSYVAGVLTFTPQLVQNRPVPGAYSFTYRVSDDQGAVSNVATVRITLQ
ncbi:MAG: hypothetical protein KGJ44_01220 [Betaproteobacteria bacterium]|nr:hypothetical protein [Betaproteobacteria bacterium]